MEDPRLPSEEKRRDSEENFLSSFFTMELLTQSNETTYCNCGVIPDPSGVAGVMGVIGPVAGVGGYS